MIGVPLPPPLADTWGIVDQVALAALLDGLWDFWWVRLGVIAGIGVMAVWGLRSILVDFFLSFIRLEHGPISIDAAGNITVRTTVNQIKSALSGVVRHDHD